MQKKTDDRALLIRILDEAYQRPTWNEVTLRGSISKMGDELGGRRQPGAKHSIAEIVLHCAYWKNRVRHRLLGDRTKSFPRKGSNWFDVEELSEEGWSDILGIINDEHRKLRDAVEAYEGGLSFDDDSQRDAVRQLFGVAMHDAYHTGQVCLLKKTLAADAHVSPRACS